MEEADSYDAPASRPTLTLDDLQRWEDHGATWNTLELDDRHAIVQLCTCYGEPVDIVRGEEPQLIEFIRRRREGEAGEPGPG
jgi:hypothetical protein